jgi:hypothetical protein
MQTEDKENIKQSRIKFHTKDEEILLYLQPSIQCTFHSHDVIHISEERISFTSADKINQHFFIIPSILFAQKHSGTFLNVPRSWPFDFEMICFNYSARLFNDTLLYRSQRIFTHVGWHNVARCTKQRRSFLSHLLPQKNNSWRLIRCQRCRPERPHPRP